MSHTRCASLLLLLLLVIFKPVPSRSAIFDVSQTLEVKIPENAGDIRVWLALPRQDPAQQVRNLRILSPVPYRTVRDSEDNPQIFFELRSPREGQILVEATFTVTRSKVVSEADIGKTRALTLRERAELARFLRPDREIPITKPIQDLANQIAGSNTNPVRVARMLYDWLIENTDYYAKNPTRLRGSDKGSALYCLKTRTGNCGDMGSLWIALARARQIPARMLYGSLFKPDLDGKNEDVNAHSWVEFYAPGIGWTPLDVSLGDMYADDFKPDPEAKVLLRMASADGTYGNDPRKREYYFGNLDERRMTWSRGRDLILQPRQSGGPLNSLFEAHVEVNGQAPPTSGQGWVRKVTYKERR